MANWRRGEVEATLGDKQFVLCLTLGALAELESAFGATDLAGLAARFESGRLSARDLIAVLGCGVRGGGVALSNEEIAALPIPGGLQGYVRVAARLLAATFGTDAETDAPAIPPEPQGA